MSGPDARFRVLSEVLVTRFGAGALRPNETFGGGVCSPCPVCRGTTLTLDRDGGLDCMNGCVEDTIIEALGIDLPTSRVPERPTSDTERHRNDKGNGGSYGRPQSGQRLVPVSFSVSEPFSLSGEELRHRINNLGRDPRAAALAFADLGLDIRPQGPFRCSLPGHDGAARFARHEPSGVYRYECLHQGVSWSIAQLRAAQSYGHLRRLKAPQEVIWYRRAFFDAGIVRPEPIALPPVPKYASDNARRLAPAFQTLFELRWITERGQPVPFGRFFATAWAEFHKPNDVYHAINELRELGIVTCVGTIEGGGRSRGAYLYVPGATPAEQALASAS